MSVSPRRVSILGALLICACADTSTTPRTPVTSVELTPVRPAVSPGDTLHLKLAAFGETGRLTDVKVHWTNSNPPVADLTGTGVATGITLGSAVITAGAGGLADTVTLRVVNSFSSVQAGNGFVCGLSPTRAAYCWGSDYAGELGWNGGGDTAGPVRVVGGVGFDALAVGTQHVCGLTAAGTAYCWGSNGLDALGPLSYGLSNSTTPVPAGINATLVTIAAGYYQTCGIDAAHTAYCWGSGLQGQPFADTIAFGSISPGYSHTCGLGLDGTAYCWGNNNYGQLGVPGPNGSGSPVAVNTPQRFSLVVMGNYHTCGLTLAREAWCWGYGETGALGSRSGSGGPNPQLVTGGHQWATISAGGYETCGITTGGDTYCWGFLSYLETPYPQYFFNPRLFAQGYHVDQITISGDARCGRTVGGGAYCWGYGFRGALGNGLRIEADRPLRVFDP